MQFMEFVEFAAFMASKGTARNGQDDSGWQ